MVSKAGDSTLSEVVGCPHENKHTDSANNGNKNFIIFNV
ncbi:hypothetical protein FM107_00180 [Sphingobacterium sp. JB170]|nr:hypothetical protein FM107_00180 [Sphingobacterium sp. JB170]